MLKMAQNKTKLFLDSHITTIENLQLNQTFDLILVRQAINYLMNMDGLVKGFEKIYQHLNYGGKLIFNAPNFIADNVYSDKQNEYQKDEWNINVREMNILQNKILTHSQYCILVKKDCSEVKKVYDLNNFGLFTKDEFETVLNKVGFKDVKFFSNNLSGFQEKAKTLYCVCKKGK
jgi:trans-aconitate methyltransferase